MECVFGDDDSCVVCNCWDCVSVPSFTVDMHTHLIHTQNVENVGSTHRIIYLQDSSIGDDYEIFVGKRLLQRDVVNEQEHTLVCVSICLFIYKCSRNLCLATEE